MKVSILEYLSWESPVVASDWFDVTEEEYTVLKCKYELLVDYGKDFYLEKARECKAENDKRQQKIDALRKKQEKEKEAKALERKRKKLADLKKELETDQT